MSPRLTISDLEVEQQKEPFTVVLTDEAGNDVEYTFPDPKAQSFDFIMGFGTRSPAQTVEAILGPETYVAFRKHPKVTGYVMNEIMAQYAKHFGIRAPGEAPASPQ